ncbi:HNH endonuclease [Burkholderia pseudomallei]|nr:HNH endonuclease [Burkholderia pseudomallei]
MTTLAQLTKRRAAFESFLVARGAQILQPTNEWEVLRFKTHKGTHVVYRNAKQEITFTGDSFGAWYAFERGLTWNGALTTKREKKDQPIVATLLARDGSACFFCRKEMTPEDRTLEHLVPIAHGGPNHLSNLVLAHRTCNQIAGHLSLMEKIRIRENGGTA